ncbi:MAG: hypothetical protein V3U93_04390 [Alphaproteobacteria bacterium]
MDYSKLKNEIMEIASIATGVPEPFRAKCFEILLTHLLAPTSQKRGPATPQTPQEGKVLENDGTKPPLTASISLPASIRAFMKKTGITDDELAKAVYYEDEDFHFLIEPSSKTVSRGQVEWALLLTLRNGIVSNNFAVDPEDVRSMCQEKGYYDPTNFWKAFKSTKNKVFFSGELKAHGDGRKLTAAGQDELAKVLRDLVG